MVIGLTGPFASGKSTAAEAFASLGYKTIEVDSIGHGLLKDKTIKNRIVQVFGRGILKNGQIDRKILGALAFADPSCLKCLNQIVHAPLKKKTTELINKYKKKNIILTAALIFELGLDQLCKKSVLITSPRKLLYKRGRKRNGFPVKIINVILRSQMPLYEKRKRADYVIENRGSLPALKKAVLSLEKRIKPES